MWKIGGEMAGALEIIADLQYSAGASGRISEFYGERVRAVAAAAGLGERGRLAHGIRRLSGALDRFRRRG